MMLIPTHMRKIPSANHQKDVGSTRDSTTITPAAAMIPPIVRFRLFIRATPSADIHPHILCARSPVRYKAAKKASPR